MIRPFLLFFVVLVSLAGCVGTSTYDYKTSTKPYTIGGNTYYPMASANRFNETGLASWYGSGFHGKKTASGQVYDKYEYTAAHKTLPFGTRVKVENLDNGMMTEVVINDRGPFKSGRIIDLSYAAAKQIDMVKSGVVPVRITAIGSVKKKTVVATKKTDQKKVASGGNDYYVQVATFSVKGNATKAAKKLSNMGYAHAMKQKNGKYVIVAGPYGTRARATKARNNLRKTYSDAFITE